MSEESPKVSVIVPHYNDLAGLDACLAALCAQEGIARNDYEIIVGDNQSPVGMEEVAKVIAGRAKLVEATERGAGPARNAAVEHARGSIFAFTDSDCVPSAHWLANGIKLVGEKQIIGGHVGVSVDDPSNMSGAEAFERIFAFNFKRYIEQLGFTGSGNLFCRKEDFETVGPFRVGVSEDREWSFRARSKGCSISYAPDAKIDHPARRSWAELKAKWVRINRETFLLAREDGMSRVEWIARAWLLPASILPHSFKCLTSSAIAGSRARSRALTTLIRLRLWRFWDYHRLAFSS